MTSTKSILVHLDSSSTASARLEVAHRLAAVHDAALTALFAATPADLQYPSTGMAGAEFPFAPAMREFEAERRARALALFEKARAGGMPRLTWAELARHEPPAGFARHALYADLVVLGQREPKTGNIPDVPSDFVESVLFDSGRPALVVPYIGAPAAVGQTVLLAWKPTREAARAASAALPLMQSARKVHVALWGDPGTAAQDASGPLQTWLQAHGIAAQVHRYGEVTRHIGEHLLSAASDLGADLLVMGCYGHSRAREWVLGGATRVVLRSMTLPVLMSH